MERNNAIFIQSFERLKTVINIMAFKEGSTSMEISAAVYKNSRVKRCEKELRYIREVRNLLSHQHGQFGGAPFMVSDIFLARVDKLTSFFSKKMSANDVGVSLRDLYTARLSSFVKNLADKMIEDKFSHVPILDDDNVLLGVFNESAVFESYLCEEVIGLEAETKIEDLMPFCEVGRQRTEAFKFIKPSASLDDIADLFSGWEGDAARLGAVFVTASGKDSDPVQRMMTAWDVLVGLDEEGL